MDRTTAIREMMKAAFKKKSCIPTIIALPLSLAPRAANDLATFSIKTAEEILDTTYKPEEIEGEGLIVYYTPSFREDEKKERFLTYLRAYRDYTKKRIILFILLTQDTPHPNLEEVWATTGMFKKELYEVQTSWHKISLFQRKRISFFGLVSLGWKKKLQEWEWDTL